MSKEKEYYQAKRAELLEFCQDMENRKSLAQQKIKERGRELREEITNKANQEIENDKLKQQEKLKIAEQIEKASMEGNLELLQQLFEKMNQL